MAQGRAKSITSPRHYRLNKTLARELALIDKTALAIIEAEQQKQAVFSGVSSSVGANAPSSTTSGSTESNDKLQAELMRLQDSLKTKLQLEQEHFLQRQAIASEAFDAKLVTETERGALLEGLKRQHMANLEKIQQQGLSREAKLWQANWQGKAKIVSGVLGNLSALMNSQNKKQFELGKKAAISQAVIDTILAAQKSYQALAGIPIVGPALGAAAAATAIVAGKVRINAIKSTQFGGGAGVSVGGGGGVSVGSGFSSGAPSQSSPSSTTASSASPVIVNVNFLGDTLGLDDIDTRVVEAVKKAVDRDDVIIASNSRNGLELAGAT